MNALAQPFPPIPVSDGQLEEVVRRRKLVKLIWHLTNRCNLGCSYCYVMINRFRDDLPTGKMLSIADKINESGASNVQLTGGEVLLRPDFLEILNRLDSRLRVGVATNGTLITPDIVRALADRRAFVSISLDHFLHFQNVLTRQGTDTGRLMLSLRMLIDSGVEVGVSTVVTRHNFREINRIAMFLREQGVRSWKAILLNEVGEAAKANVASQLALSYEDKGSVLRAVSELRRTYRSSGFIVKAGIAAHPAFFELFGREADHSTSCLCGYVKATVKHDGGLVPCDSIGYPGDYTGAGVEVPSVLKDESIDDIFLGSKLFRYWAMATAAFAPVGCSRCEFFKMCRGFCRGRSMVAAGGLIGLFGKSTECARDARLWFEGAERRAARVVSNTRPGIQAQ